MWTRGSSFTSIGSKVTFLVPSSMVMGWGVRLKMSASIFMSVPFLLLCGGVSGRR